MTRRDLERLAGPRSAGGPGLGDVRATRLVLFTGTGEADHAVRELAGRGEILLVGPEDLVG